MTAYVASLAMYDGGELSAANDALWEAVARRLIDYGLDGVPARLDRALSPSDAWEDERLIFGQTCGYPFAARLSERLRLVGTPDYDVPGCARGQHRSFVIVHARSRLRGLRELRGSRAAINDRESMSGRHLLGDAIAALEEPPGFFASVVTSGSHARSVAMVAGGAADVAAVDCVSYHHLTRSHPEAVSETRIIARTRPTPCLPFVIATACGEVTASLVARALREAVLDPRTEDARRVLGLARILSVRQAAYERSLIVAARADATFRRAARGAPHALAR